MKMLPRDFKIDVRWSGLGSPNTAGEHRPDFLRGDPVAIQDVDIANAKARGGDPFVRLINLTKADAKENYWVVLKVL